MHSLRVLLLACILLRWCADCVLLKQLEPPNGTSACPGDRIKLVCNTTSQNENTLTWQVIGGKRSSGFWGKLMNAFSGTLKLPNGANATWEAETLHHTSPGLNTTITSSLIINASLDLHNVTIVCCSENSSLSSMCSDSSAIPNEYKGIAVINISPDSKCENKFTKNSIPGQAATYHTSQYSLMWGITSLISLLACLVALAIQIKELISCSTSDEMKVWVLTLLIDAIIFAAINASQIIIYYLNKAETTCCTVVGCIFQVNLICTIFITTLLTLYLYAKFQNSTQELNCFSFCTKHIRSIMAVGVVAIAVVIVPGVSHNYGDAGAWCWIKNNDNIAGVSFQIITSSLGLIAALVCIVLAIMEFCKHHEDYNDKYVLATVMCFLVSFFVGNCVSLINRTTLAYGTPNRGFMFFHSTVNPLWPLVTALPTIIQSICKIRTVKE